MKIFDKALYVSVVAEHLMIEMLNRLEQAVAKVGEQAERAKQLREKSEAKK